MKGSFTALCMKKKVLLGCVVPLFLFGGCTALLVAVGTETTTTSTTKESVSQTSNSIPIGEMTDVRNDRAVQVDSLEVVDSLSIPYAEPLTGGTGKLAVLYFQVQNTGKETGSLVFSTYDLIDSQGRKYSEISDFMEAGQVWLWAESQGLGSPSQQLFPGETAPTAKVFQVAPDAEGFKVLINDKEFDAQ